MLERGAAKRTVRVTSSRVLTRVTSECSLRRVSDAGQETVSERRAWNKSLKTVYRAKPHQNL